MFDRIKKAFARDGKDGQRPGQAPATGSSWATPVSEWAATHGLAFTTTNGGSFSLQGRVADKPWRLEVGHSSREYIRGEELRARAELGIRQDVAVVVMSRPLKESLEKQAYEHCTDALQTTVNAAMPEEMRWLAMYDEVGWDSVPRVFWSRYAVLAGVREHAPAWLDPLLAAQLLDWPTPDAGAGRPFLLTVLRGKAYLRMQQDATDTAVLQHAARVFTTACENALDVFPGAASRA